MPRKLIVTTDFPSGSADVLHVDSDAREIVIQPVRYAARGFEAWWFLKIGGVEPGETLTVRLTGGTLGWLGSWAWMNRAMYSSCGAAWSHTEPGITNVAAGVRYMSYVQQCHGSEAWFAYALPYTHQHAGQLMAEAKNSTLAVEVFELCKSSGGRSVPSLRFSRGSGDTRPHVWLQARCHAFESGASWALHGLAQWLLSGDPDARSLLNLARVTAVPVMDIDSVKQGRSGKGQHPRDHARDWDATPYWPESKAATSLLESDDSLAVFIDIHGPGRAAPYFFVPSQENLAPEQHQNLQSFLSAFPAEEWTGNPPISATDSYFVISANSPATPCNWVRRHTSPGVVAAALEVAMNTPLSDQAGYKVQGEALGKGILRYLQGLHVLIL